VLALACAIVAVAGAVMGMGVLRALLVQMVVLMGMHMVMLVSMVVGVGMGHTVVGVLVGMGVGMFVVVGAHMIVMNVHSNSPLRFFTII
jgi:hypothetical protein